MEIHPKTLQTITQKARLVLSRHLPDNVEANAVFLDILTHKRNPLETLRLMNDTSVLGYLLPEFGAVVGMMQFNRYHHYTVDEHTFRAVGVMHRIAADDGDDGMGRASSVFGDIVQTRFSWRVVFHMVAAPGIRVNHTATRTILGRVNVRRQ